MKKLILLCAVLFALGTVAAQDRTQSRRNFDAGQRFVDRIWFSAVYTPKILLTESLSGESVELEPGKTTAHNYAFEAGYMLLPRLSLGIGVGYERYWIATGTSIDMVPLYLHADYFYGKRRGGFFNYARVGALLSADACAKTGFTGGAGVGYRLMLYRRLGVDFKIGYDYSHATADKRFWAPQQFDPAGWSRHSLSLGVGLVF